MTRRKNSNNATVVNKVATYLTKTEVKTMTNAKMAPKERKLYVAYGSNLNVGQMKYRCPDAVPMYKGLLPDYELFYAGSMSGFYATIRPCAGKSVPVVVWEISETDEQSLDRYEGFPSFYYKRTITFEAGGEEHSAMVYIMRDGAKEGTPSEYYESVVRQGYRDFGLDQSYLNESIYGVAW